MATKAGGAYIEIRGDDKRLKGDLDGAHRKVVTAANKMQSQVTKSFKIMAVAATAALAAITYKTVSLMKESALLAARFETLGIVMKQVGGNAGYSAEQMDNFDTALRKTGISMIESRNSLAKMAQAQLDLTKATELGRVAQDAAVMGNINSSEAFGRMIEGIQTGRVMILKTIGIQVDFARSYKEVAAATDRTVASFSEAEKVIIRQNAVLKFGERIAGTYEAAMETAGKKLGSFTRYVEDFKVKMGKAFGPSMVIVMNAATKAMKQMQVEISKPEAQKALKDMSVSLAKIVASLGEDLPGKIDKIRTALSKIWNIISYDPAIIEYGLIGLVIGGKKGAILIGGMAHMVTWVQNLGAALELAGKGVIKYSDIAKANFKELEELVKKGVGEKEILFSIGTDTTGYDKYLESQKKPIKTGGVDTGGSGTTTTLPKDDWLLKSKIAAFEEEERLRSESWQAEIEWSNHVIELAKEKEQERLQIVAEANQAHAEIGMTRFDLERAQVERMTEIYRQAGVDEVIIAKITAKKIKDIADAEQQTKLSIYRDVAGGIADTFLQIAQAGGEQSKKAFIAYKAFAMVEAAIAGRMAILNAMKDYSPPYSFIMAGIAGAAAAVQIGMIGAAQPPSYETGTDYVPRTGLAMLHEGERVVTKKENQKYSESKKQEEKPTEINIMNVFDPIMLEEFMSSSRGQDAIVNVIGNRSESIRRVLR